jgi:hypothetical protein
VDFVYILCKHYDHMQHAGPEEPVVHDPLLHHAVAQQLPDILDDLPPPPNFPDDIDVDGWATFNWDYEADDVATEEAAGPAGAQVRACTQQDATLNPLWKQVPSSEQLLNCKVQGIVAPVAPCAPLRQDTTLEAVGNLASECCTYVEEVSAKGETTYKLDTKTFKPLPLDQQLLQQVSTAITEWMVETGRLVQQEHGLCTSHGDRWSFPSHKSRNRGVALPRPYESENRLEKLDCTLKRGM